MAAFALMPDPESSSYVHATALIVGEAGVLIRGPAGSGKSSLAVRLIAEASRCGRFARLVGDDRVSVVEIRDVIVARPHPIIAGQIERRTFPLAVLPYEHACVVRLVVELCLQPLPRMPDVDEEKIKLRERVELPVLRLAARSTELSWMFVLQELVGR
jgi:HPr kinase/phosphorylase